MKRWQTVVEFILLAAVWGGSFLFMRVAAPEFGPVWLIELRLALASAVLVPLMLHRGLGPIGLAHWRPLLLVGVLNSALPFVLLAYATLTLPAGLTSILNATAPLFGTAIALIWLKEHHSIAQLAGLGLGFLGVVVLLGWQPSTGASGFGLAVVAGLGAACCYAIAAPYVRHHLAGVSTLVIAAGSIAGASLVLLPLLPFTIPRAMPSTQSVTAVIALALLSTALAYLLYFRLIAHLGSTRALTVGYLIPLFAMVWGVLWLGETVTAAMGLGCGLVLLGTAIANRPLSPRSAPPI
ncbi:MAG: DMT family transporter, partial [Nodosilinea sp.]